MTADELREWMARKRWTTAALARELDRSASTISRWRSGEQPIPKTVELAIEALERREAVGRG